MPLDASATTLAFGAIALLIAALLRPRPQVILYLALPVLLWPMTPVPVSVAVAWLVVLTGVSLGRGWGVWLGTATVAACLWVTYVIAGPPDVVSHTAAVNSLSALSSYLLLVPAAAAIRPSPLTLVRVLALSGTAAAAFIIAAGGESGGRAYLETFNSDAVGMAAAIAMVAVIAAARMGGKAWALLLPVSGAAFYYAQTRAALVVLVVGLVVPVLARTRGRQRVLLVIASMLAAPIIWGALPAVQSVLFARRDERFLEVQSRWDVLGLAVRTAADHPLLGIGWRHFTDVSLEEMGVVLNAHNDLALLAAEGGLLPLVLLAILGFRSLQASRQPMVAALLCACFAALAMGNVMADPRVTAPLWVLMGCALGARQLHKADHQGPKVKAGRTRRVESVGSRAVARRHVLPYTAHAATYPLGGGLASC